MKRLILEACFLLFVFSCAQDRYRFVLPKLNSTDLKFAPQYYNGRPDLPSPALSEINRELVLLELKNGCYSWFDATVENGKPFDYKKRLYGKGNQLLAAAEDFPALARKGIHSDEDLGNAKTITGRSVSQITIDGRPWGSSGVGFLAEDETIMSVIYADNRTVNNMNLTHPDLARPLFHLWNISRKFEKSSLDSTTNKRMEIAALVYNGQRVEMKITGSRGWQESIFDDEILGTGHIEIWRELNTDEVDFLERNYNHLTTDQLEKLSKMLSFIHTGEMVFFYINRYGFYEGHTEYRVDPVAVVLIFGLRSIKEVHQACDGDLFTYFNSHFTHNPE